jgi:hypothetical protein
MQKERSSTFIIGAALAGLAALLMAIGAYSALMVSDGSIIERSVDLTERVKPAERYPGMPGFISRSLADDDVDTEKNSGLSSVDVERDAAVFAWWMVVVSSISVIVTTIGTILLFSQIRQTRQALQQGREATNAANDANQIAKLIGSDSSLPVFGKR